MHDPPPIRVDRPRLLVLASTYPRWPGDHEPGFVHELSKRLVGKFEVTVLCPHAPGARTLETMDGVEVVRYRYAPEKLESLVNDGGIVTNLRLHMWKYLLVPGFILAQAWHVWRLSRSPGFDVIHAHWLLPQGLIAAALGSSRANLPFVVTSHGADLYALKGAAAATLKRFVIKKATAATVASNAMCGEVLRISHQGSPPQVLPMGVDFDDRFTPGGNPRDPFEILFVGRLVEKKGLRFLIGAMPEILARHPQAKLTVAGFGPDEDILREMTRTLGLMEAVNFVGAVKQSELPDLYRRASVFAAPFVIASDGDHEGLGLVTIEAIACGCPVIVSSLPAVDDILDATACAEMLVPPGNSSALATAVNHVLANPEHAREQALQLRKQIASRYNWDSVATRYGDLLLRVGAGQ